MATGTPDHVSPPKFWAWPPLYLVAFTAFLSESLVSRGEIGP